MIGYIVLGTIALTVVLFLLIAYVYAQSNNSEDQFFLCTNELSQRDIISTLGVSWFSLGSSFLSLLLIAAYYGLVPSIFSVLTWGAGFWLVSRHAERIQATGQSYKTLNAFLGDQLSSSFFRVFTSIVTLVTVVGIVAGEIIVVAGLFTISSAVQDSAILSGMILAMLTLTIATYTGFGGLRVVLKTETVQIFIISIAMVVLAAGAGLYLSDPAKSSPDEFLWTGWSPKDLLGPHWAFFTSTLFINCLVLVADLATWQRVRSAKKVASTGYRNGILLSGFWTVLAWGLIVFIGLALKPVVPSVPDLAGGFSEYLKNLAAPITTMLVESHATFAFLGGFISGVLIAVTIAGFSSAMMSTSDTLSLAGSHTLARDLCFPAIGQTYDSEKVLFWGRFVVVAILCLAFTVAFIAILTNVDFLGMLFVFFGVLCVLGPVVLWAIQANNVPLYTTGRAMVVLGVPIVYIVGVCVGFAGLFGGFDRHIAEALNFLPGTIAGVGGLIVVFAGVTAEHGIRAATQTLTNILTVGY